MGFFGRLLNSLAEAFSAVDEDFYDELEEQLILGDLGVEATEKIIEDLRERVRTEHIMQPEDLREALHASLRDMMRQDEHAYDFEEGPSVVLLIGVNGVGKTTSAGKLAGLYKAQGKRVLLCAADTFRAAAIEQLTEWSHRAGVEIIAQSEGSDPAAVVFDATQAAKARHTDILIADTAGRLHNKKNLMEELKKIYRILEKEYSSAKVETLLVLDGTTGQNALSQAREFSQASNVDGIILTKMEGTAKGGIGIAIESELKLNVKFIGTGEKPEDLSKFDAGTYVDSIFAEPLNQIDN